MNVFVAKLSPATRSQDLETLFGVYGEIVSAKIIFDRDTGNSKGYGFIEMKNDDEARTAIEALNESEVDGNQIVVKEAIPREERSERPQKKTLQRRGEYPDQKNNYGSRRY